MSRNGGGGGSGAGKLAMLVAGGLVVGAIGGLALLDSLADGKARARRRRRRRMRSGGGNDDAMADEDEDDNGEQLVPEFLTEGERNFLALPSPPQPRTESQRRAYSQSVGPDEHGAFWLQCISLRSGGGRTADKQWLSRYGAIYEQSQTRLERCSSTTTRDLGDTPAIVRRDLHRTFPSSALFRVRAAMEGGEGYSEPGTEGATGGSETASDRASTVAGGEEGGGGGGGGGGELIGDSDSVGSGASEAEDTRDNQGQKELEGVLLAYALYDPEVSYVQGMNFIVGLLLHNMGPRQAFAVLVALMKPSRPIGKKASTGMGDDHQERGKEGGGGGRGGEGNILRLKGPGFGMRSLFTPEMPMLHIRFYQLRELLKVHLPKLAVHFERIGLPPIIYSNEWFLTLFTYVYDAEDVVRVWDIFFVDGVAAIFRIGLAILKVLEPRLLLEGFDGSVSIIKGFFQREGRPGGRRREGGGGGGGGGGGAQSTLDRSIRHILPLSLTFNITNEHLTMLEHRLDIRFFQLQRLIELHLPSLSSHLQKVGVRPRHFAYYKYMYISYIFLLNKRTPTTNTTPVI